MAGVVTVLIIIAIAVGFLIYQRFYSNTNNGRRRGSLTGQQSYARSQNSAPTYKSGGMPSNSGRPLAPAARSNITETGPMVYFANDRHGRRDKEYRFNYKKVGDGWRAYILRMPSMEGRSSDAAITHRLHDAEGYYVCWDQPIHTLKEMQTVSRVWADSIQKYIATGKRFG